MRSKILFVIFLVLVLYNSTFTQVNLHWAKHYDYWQTDNVYSMEIDISQNIYVLGDKMNLRKYDYCGRELWTSYYNYYSLSGSMIIVNQDDETKVAICGMEGNSSYRERFITVMYSSSGSQLWSARYEIYGNDCRAKTLVSDESGNIYVTGYCTEDGWDFQFLTIKYDMYGNEQWVRTLNLGQDEEEEPVSINTDNSGNVYIAGWFEYIDDDKDYALLKYNPDGNLEWYRTYHGPFSEGDDVVTDLAVDNDGTCFVTGSSQNEQGINNYTTIKYYSNGDLGWLRRFSGGIGGEATDIEIDNNSGIIVTGGCVRTQGAYYDYATIKYNYSGDLLWDVYYDGAANINDYCKAMTYDVNDNVYVTGQSAGTGNFDYVTIMYNSSGSQQWEKRFDRAGLNDDGKFICVSENGIVYVAGNTSISANNDITTLKYAPGLSTCADEDVNLNKDFNIQNYPNPFNPTTSIIYSIPVEGLVVLKIFNSIGQEVETIVNEFRQTGVYKANFDAVNLPSGVYFYKISVNTNGSVNWTQTKKMVLIK